MPGWRREGKRRALACLASLGAREVCQFDQLRHQATWLGNVAEDSVHHWNSWAPWDLVTWRMTEKNESEEKEMVSMSTFQFFHTWYNRKVSFWKYCFVHRSLTLCLHFPCSRALSLAALFFFFFLSQPHGNTGLVKPRKTQNPWHYGTIATRGGPFEVINTQWLGEHSVNQNSSVF